MTRGIAHGVAHLIAEDEQLGGRFLTLHNRRQVNFGSCSYVGLETDVRLKAAAIELKLLTAEEFDAEVRPERMVGPNAEG